MKFNFWMIKTRQLFSTIAFHSYKKPLFIRSEYFFLPCTLYFKRHSMDLSAFIKIFEEKVPPYLAESWDNTGLLVDSNKTEISTVLFTNDLTEDVLDEALDIKANLIISYHPPIFAPIKSLKNSNWKERIIIKCIENSIAVYSPHTACDAVGDGVNDWLINSLGVSQKQPISASYEYKPKYSHMLDFTVYTGDEIGQVLQNLHDAEICSSSVISDDKENFRVKVSEVALKRILKLLTRSGDVESASIKALDPLPILTCGAGRIGSLLNPSTLEYCIKKIKKYLKLEYIRFAISPSHILETIITTVAVCAGSGASVLKGVTADLYITGEMSHHDILDANHRGVSVILCEHSNSERGYLGHLAESLRPKLEGVKLIVSSVDKDPIIID